MPKRTPKKLQQTGRRSDVALARMLKAAQDRGVPHWEPKGKRLNG